MKMKKNQLVIMPPRYILEFTLRIDGVAFEWSLIKPYEKNICKITDETKLRQSIMAVDSCVNSKAKRLYKPHKWN